MSVWDDVIGFLERAGHDAYGLLFPGGDPDAIHAAATASRTLATGIASEMKAMSTVASGMESYWRGLGPSQDTSAAAAYQTAFGTFSKTVSAFVGEIQTAAGHIDDVGDAVAQADSAASKTRIAIEATVAAGLFLSIVTAGLSDADAMAIAEIDADVLAGEMSSIEAFVQEVLIRLAAAVTTSMPNLAIQFSLGFLSDAIADVFGKFFQYYQQKDGKVSTFYLLGDMLTHPGGGLRFIVDPDSYDPTDVDNAVLGGSISMFLGPVSDIPALAAFSKAHPLIDASAWGFTAAFTWALPWDFYAQGDSVTDGHVWLGILESSVASAGLAPALRGLGNVPKLKVLFPTKELAFGVKGTDFTNNVISGPVSGAKLILFTGLPPAAFPTVPGVAAGGGAGAGLPAGIAVPQVPAHIGGGKYTVAPGDNLYDIAGKQLGNANLYPALQAANPLAVGSDGTIIPGSKLLIPVLPSAPAGSVAHVVQAGQTLSQIAGGNPALEQQIAKLNNVSDSSLIYPGQVLIVPPGG